TAAVVPPGTLGGGRIAAREPLVLAGLAFAERAFALVDGGVEFRALVDDGERCEPSCVVAELRGELATILTAERVALNFLQHLSGIATSAARFVAALGGTGVELRDTRKTTPGLRIAEKYAVRVGGGSNHRFGLYDGVLVKDNHIAAAGTVAEATRRARQGSHSLLAVEVEVESLAAAREAIAAGADELLLDNRPVEELAAIVATIRAEAPGVALEASGGITLETIAGVAATGVDAISSGAVVHAARWVDLGLDLESG
ncbi:MAG: carboxylating nicotinate-nucleotide diphosphorylase, partial [Myxococcota bacterium]|nr:carboxylating nicotinate-nucleotide diphosphorylase [Myxococcota bacterium]